jgi:hypothetical protein
MLAFATLLTLFGPSLAADGLEALGCTRHPESCGRGLGALATWLAPWLSAQPPLETGFVLLEQCWPLLLIWSGLIVLSMRADRIRLATCERSNSVQVASPAETTADEQPCIHREPKGQGAWIKARQDEQQAELRQRERTLNQRLFAEGFASISMTVTCCLLLAALLSFCVAFGLPLLGGLSAEALLGALDCVEPANQAPPAQGGACGFWLARLAPYRQPFVGALLSPIWLFSQFFDLLLIWLGLILMLALLPIYRLGGLILLWTELRLISRALFVLFAMSLLGLGYFVFFAAPTFKSSNPGDPVPGVGLLLGLLEMLLALPLLGLVVITMALLAALSVWLLSSRPNGPG